MKVFIFFLLVPFIGNSQFCIENWGYISSDCYTGKDSLMREINEYVREKKAKIHLYIIISDEEKITYGKIIGIGRSRRKPPGRNLNIGRGIIIKSPIHRIYHNINRALRNVRIKHQSKASQPKAFSQETQHHVRFPFLFHLYKYTFRVSLNSWLQPLLV